MPWFSDGHFRFELEHMLYRYFRFYMCLYIIHVLLHCRTIESGIRRDWSRLDWTENLNGDINIISRRRKHRSRA